MANDLLTVDMITREALRVLHQKLTFLGRVNRQYDDQFANSPQIGTSLRIRKPPQYTVRTTAALSVQDVDEDAITLAVTTRRGVDFSFSSLELASSIEDFSKRILQPAVSVLASNVEALVLQSLTKDVYNLVDNDGAAISFLNILQARQKIDDMLAPQDGRFTALLSTTHQVKLVDQLKGLFHDTSEVASQYRTGKMGRTGGADFYQSTHASDMTSGTAVKGDTLRNISGANQTGSAITVDTTGSTTLVAGDVVTLAGVNRVHPETKVDTGEAQQFVVTSALSAAGTTLNISPAIVITGGKQNVTASPTNGGAVTKLAAGNVERINGSLYFHEDAFTFATIDLPLPDGVHFAGRQVEDGISLRIIRQYDINNDLFPCRLDIQFGWLATRPEHACRIHADG